MEIEENEFFPPTLTDLPRVVQNTLEQVRSTMEQSRFLVSLSRQLLRENRRPVWRFGSRDGDPREDGSRNFSPAKY
jgi:hypothetical protein